MSISYPLNTPTNIGIANITLSAENAVAISQSPFTFQQQVVAHPGQRWAASVSLPPMKRQDAEYWIAFLLSLKGQIGTFLLGDPNCVDAQGSATAKRNLLVNTPFAGAVTGTPGTTPTSWNRVLSGGTITAGTNTLRVQTTAARDLFHQNPALATNTTYFWSVEADIGLSSPIIGYINVANLPAGAVVNSYVLDGADVGLLTLTGTGSHTLGVRYTMGATSGSPINYIGSGVSGNLTGDITFTKPQLEVGSSRSVYQAIADAYGPFVSGGGQTGDTLVIDGCSPNVTGFFLPGDYIQIGSGSATQLYKVLTQVNTDGSGGATLDIWPNLRSSPADNAAIVVANTKGRFRLKDNIQQWQINEISSYGITFDCVEAI